MAPNATYMYCLLAFMLLPDNGSAQYATEAGTTGTDAIYADSSIIKSWATGCRVVRGYMQIDDKDAGKASTGSDSDCLGKADNTSVSLGDSGIAVITFGEPVPDIPGADFAVFENSFDGQFLELAFVEVSNDSMRWVRFPSVSLTPYSSQTGTFGTTKPEMIKNLAGKYKVSYGTPFDIAELKDSAGLDLDNVRYIRIIDVIGNVADPFSSFDSHHNRINDPWPTPFPQSGFDLDAVAILNAVAGKTELNEEVAAKLYPNPVFDMVTIKFRTPGNRKIMLFDVAGCMKICFDSEDKKKILDLSMLKPGLYFVKIDFSMRSYVHKLIIN
jgi:hypothetical protein